MRPGKPMMTPARYNLEILLPNICKSQLKPKKEMYPNGGIQAGRQGLNLLNLTKKGKVISEGQIKICNTYAHSEDNIFYYRLQITVGVLKMCTKHQVSMQ